MTQQEKIAARDKANLSQYLKQIQPSRVAKLTKTLNASQPCPQ
jgi:hypothetical protein